MISVEMLWRWLGGQSYRSCKTHHKEGAIGEKPQQQGKSWEIHLKVASDCDMVIYLVTWLSMSSWLPVRWCGGFCPRWRSGTGGGWLCRTRGRSCPERRACAHVLIACSVTRSAIDTLQSGGRERDRGEMVEGTEDGRCGEEGLWRGQEVSQVRTQWCGACRKEGGRGRCKAHYNLWVERQTVCSIRIKNSQYIAIFSL